MTEAIVMDGGRRGELVKVCADLTCRVHHPDTPSPQKVERQRAEERKRVEKDKLTVTTRHRILAAVLERVSEPLKKGDSLTVASYVMGQLPHSQVPIFAKRHKVEDKKNSHSRQELLAKRVSTYSNTWGDTWRVFVCTFVVRMVEDNCPKDVNSEMRLAVDSNEVGCSLSIESG